MNEHLPYNIQGNTMTKHVAVIILQYGNEQATIDCIKSVEAYNSAPIKYIIVDNGSPDSKSAETIISFVKQNASGTCAVVDDDYIT